MLVSGCVAPQPFGPSPGGEPTRPPTAESSATTPYLIQPGDVLEVKFYYNDKLSDRSRVRPDGKITLQLVGDVQAAGLSPEQLRNALLQLYAPHQRTLEIAVMVREFAGQKIYVGGEVNSPGAIDAFGNLTAIKAIIAAGGLKNSAEIRTVVVLRELPGKEPLFTTINLEESAKDSAGGGSFPLRPFDVVFVPKSSISQLGQFVDQYFNQIIPITFTVGFSWFKGLTSR